MSCILIAGLGNPGTRYHLTRHNIGFMVLDFLSQTLGFTFTFDKKFNAEVGVFHTEAHKVFLLKPHTFMNASGESVAAFAQYFGIAHTLVIHDDADIYFGDIRFKYGGSSGGHNGLKSIDKLMGRAYLRLRFGIGRDSKQSIVDFVLGYFNAQEMHDIERLMPFIKEAIMYFCTNINDTQETLIYLQNHFTRRHKNTQQKADSIHHSNGANRTDIDLVDSMEATKSRTSQEKSQKA